MLLLLMYYNNIFIRKTYNAELAKDMKNAQYYFIQRLLAIVHPYAKVETYYSAMEKN